MIRLGLVGFPLEHSLSPLIHQKALRLCGLKGDYQLYAIRPEDQSGLKMMVEKIRAGDLTGLNVTIPHKQVVIPLLDELTSTAEDIGAVNTIICNDGRLVGDNTDGQGFWLDLQKLLGRMPQNQPGTAVVLGAGGSARAVVSTLLKQGWKIRIAARRKEQAEAAARHYFNVSDQLSAAKLDSGMLSNLLTPPDLIVNTTPAGMQPLAHRSPWPEQLPLPKDAAVYDLVYNPRQTRLLLEAAEAGLPHSNGLGMLVEQALLSFQIWTGKTIHQEHRNAILEELWD